MSALCGADVAPSIGLVAVEVGEDTIARGDVERVAVEVLYNLKVTVEAVVSCLLLDPWVYNGDCLHTLLLLQFDKPSHQTKFSSSKVSRTSLTFLFNTFSRSSLVLMDL